MKKGNVHIEGAKCVKKAQVAIDELQICPKKHAVSLRLSYR